MANCSSGHVQGDSPCTSLVPDSSRMRSSTPTRARTRPAGPGATDGVGDKLINSGTRRLLRRSSSRVERQAGRFHRRARWPGFRKRSIYNTASTSPGNEPRSRLYTPNPPGPSAALRGRSPTPKSVLPADAATQIASCHSRLLWRCPSRPLSVEYSRTSTPGTGCLNGGERHRHRARASRCHRQAGKKA